MTEEESRLLRDTSSKMDTLYQRLMEQGPTGEPPLLDRMSVVVVAAERGNWALIWGVRLVVGLGALFGAVAVIKTGFSK